MDLEVTLDSDNMLFMKFLSEIIIVMLNLKWQIQLLIKLLILFVVNWFDHVEGAKRLFVN